MSKYHPVLHTRREFLQQGVGLAAVSLTIPAWLHRSAYAVENGRARRATDRSVVIVQLSGGNDGLNTVVPFPNDDYHKARPVIGLKPDEVLKVNDELGLHPKLAPFKALYDEGHAAILLGVGYPNPNRSHFRSLEIWHTGSDSNKFERYGWIGRYFDNECKGSPSPAVGVALQREAPQAFTNLSGHGICFTDPNAFRWNPTGAGKKPQIEAESEAYRMLNTPGRKVDFLTRTALNAQITSDRVRNIASSYKARVEYPKTQFATDLRLIAGMIGGNLGSKFYYCGMGGFDTHSGQLTRHATLLDQFSSGISAFYKDLETQGLADQVLVLAFSEFGRRVRENASDGTDHGVAGPMFVVGGGVKPGLYGKYPSLTDLDSGDLKADTDFRQVYATVLENWLKAKPEPIFGRTFEKLAFV
ncbi:MAG: DUF1501 domain-containing protein [Verrucomicrobiota bacterium]